MFTDGQVTFEQKIISGRTVKFFIVWDNFNIKDAKTFQIIRTHVCSNTMHKNLVGKTCE